MWIIPTNERHHAERPIEFEALRQHLRDEHDTSFTRNANFGNMRDAHLVAHEVWVIERPEARRIASEWHGGQSSKLYAFASTGAILEGITNEIFDTGTDPAVQVGEDRYKLYEYITAHGLRGPQQGWSIR